MFLDKLPGPFFVGHEDGEIVACGGYARHYTKPDVWVLHWGMVAAEHQRKGHGTQMFFARMNTIFSRHGFADVEVVTSYRCESFFMWRGFGTLSPLEPYDEIHCTCTMYPFEHRWKTGTLDPVSEINAYQQHYHSRDWRIWAS